MLLLTSSSMSAALKLSSIEAIWHVLLLLLLLWWQQQLWRKWNLPLWLRWWLLWWLLLLWWQCEWNLLLWLRWWRLLLWCKLNLRLLLGLLEVLLGKKEHKSLDDAHSCFCGRELHLLEKQHAQWRDTGGFDCHL
jgi:hypothetical protein